MPPIELAPLILSISIMGRFGEAFGEQPDMDLGITSASTGGGVAAPAELDFSIPSNSMYLALVL